MGSKDIKKKIEMILGKKRVKNHRDFIKVYGIGIPKDKRGRKNGREPVSLRGHYQRRRNQDRRRNEDSNYSKLPQISIGNRV